ncbi:PucR family transcriptional regulator [Nocardioides sp. YIM B13467]|uniref:PucR family transcriptional regulator n=1 Tax=Nocardioides sp. YIM B13467 TaxID=3366294 RepID=UPI003670652E
MQGHWVRELRPDPNRPYDTVCSRETIEKAAAQVGTGPVEWAIQVGREMAIRVVDEMSVLGTGESAIHSMRLGTESSTIRTLVCIDAGQVAEQGATPEVVEQMRDYVHRRIPLPAVWAAIRDGHSWLADYYMAACRDLVPPDEQAVQFELISRVLFDFVNPFANGVGDAYTEEYERWVSSANAARDEAVRAVLDGDEVDLRKSSRLLSYEIEHRYHLALVMWVRDPDPHDTTALQTLGHQVMDRIDASQNVLIPVGQSEVWAWAGSATRLIDLNEIVESLGVPGLGVAVGRVGHGADGFRASHRQAQEAARVMRIRDGDLGEAVAFDDVSLVALLTRDPINARAFMHDELAGLIADEAHVADLRETVLAYFECKRSPQSTAARLFVARNTVVYRLKRAEELLGRPIDHREAELWTALLLARVYGPDTARH